MIHNTLVETSQNIQFPVLSEVTFDLLGIISSGNPTKSEFTVEVRPYNNVYESEDVTSVHTMPLLTVHSLEACNCKFIQTMPYLEIWTIN